MKMVYWITIAIIGLILWFVLLVSKNQLGSWGDRSWGIMGPGMMHGWGFGFLGWVGMILMWIFPTGLLALVILGVFELVRRVIIGKQLSPDSNRQKSAPASPVKYCGPVMPGGKLLGSSTRK